MLKNIISSQYIKSILKLTTGSIIAQVIVMLVSPISTRLYTPEELGIYTLILTFSAMFGPIVAGKYDMAIVVAKDSKETFDLIIGSIVITFITTLLITFGYIFYLNEHPMILDEVGAGAYILVAILLLQGFINVFTSYNNRNKHYTLISQVHVARSLIQNIGLVIFGLLKFGALGLLLSQFISLLFGIKKQGKYIVKDKLLSHDIDWRRIRTTLVIYKNQLIYSMPAHFINSASYSLLNLFISGLYGLSVFGYYSIAYRILGLPLNLISMNISKVFFQKASEEKKNKNNYNRTFIQITIILTLLAIPMVVLLTLFAPYLFKVVFGNGWEVAGEYVQILAPMYGIRLVVSALTPSLTISGKQRLELVLQSLFIIISLLSYFLTVFLNLNFNAFLSFISVSYSIVYVVFYVILYRSSK